MPIMKRATGLVILSALLACTRAVAEDCDSILDHGIHNTYQQLDQHNVASTYRDALCNESSAVNTYGSSAGGAVGIPIDDVPIEIKGKYDSNTVNQLKTSYCANHQSTMSEDDLHQIAAMTVDPMIVEAWSQCKSKSGGLLIDGESNGNVILFSFQFRPIGNVTSTIVTGDPQIIGAVCQNVQVKSDTILTNSRKFESCLREGSGEVTLIVNTQFDGARIFIPAISSAVTHIALPPSHPTLPSEQTLLVCMEDPARVPPDYLPGICDGHQGALGSPCSCPKYANEAPPHIIGSYPGKIIKFCGDTLMNAHMCGVSSQPGP